MAEPASIMIAAAGGIALATGLAAQLRTHRLRRRWNAVGLGLEEPTTGLATLAAVPVMFPAELATAEATDTQLAIVAIRMLTLPPEHLGRDIADALRAHEYGYRVDYDLFAVCLSVRDRNAAVLATSRIASAIAPAAGAELRVGIAICPADATDFLDAMDIATSRMRSIKLVHAVAQELRIAAVLPAPTGSCDTGAAEGTSHAA